MHENNLSWLQDLKRSYPDNFNNCAVLELGSMYVNGTVRDAFHACRFVGVDMDNGPLVDVRVKASDTCFKKGEFDTIISFSMFEHDLEWRESLAHNLPFLKEGGMVFVSFGAEGNFPHEFPIWQPIPHLDFLDHARDCGLDIMDAFFEWERYTGRSSPGIFDAVLRKPNTYRETPEF